MKRVELIGCTARSWKNKTQLSGSWRLVFLLLALGQKHMPHDLHDCCTGAPQASQSFGVYIRLVEMVVSGKTTSINGITFASMIPLIIFVFGEFGRPALDQKLELLALRLVPAASERMEARSQLTYSHIQGRHSHTYIYIYIYIYRCIQITLNHIVYYAHTHTRLEYYSMFMLWIMYCLFCIAKHKLYSLSIYILYLLCVFSFIRFIYVVCFQKGFWWRVTSGPFKVSSIVCEIVFALVQLFTKLFWQ